MSVMKKFVNSQNALISMPCMRSFMSPGYKKMNSQLTRQHYFCECCYKFYVVHNAMGSLPRTNVYSSLVYVAEVRPSCAFFINRCEFKEFVMSFEALP